MPGSKYQRDIFLIQLIFKCQFSFLSSDAFDNELIMKTLWKILQGKTVQIPVYDFVSHSRWALFHSTRHVGSRCVHGITIKLELFIIFFCIISGRTSLSLYTRQMWSYSRASSCSILRKLETCSRWSFSWTQIQIRGSPVEVCMQSLAVERCPYKRHSVIAASELIGCHAFFCFFFLFQS